MPGKWLEVEAPGAVEDIWLRQLGALMDKTRDFRQMGLALEPTIFRHLKSHYDSEGNGRWASLSPAYAAWKANHHPGRKILVLEDELRQSVIRKGAKDNIAIINTSGGRWGTRNPKARHHHYGAPRANLPKRELFVLTNELRVDVLKAGRAWFKTSIKRSGGR